MSKVYFVAANRTRMATTVRLDPEETRMAQQIAKHHRLNGYGAVFRFLLAKEMRELGAARTKVGKA